MAPVASPSNPHKRQIDAIQRVYDCAKRLKPGHESSASVPAAVSDHHSASAPTHAELGEQDSDDDDNDDGDDNESYLSESSDEPSDESDIEDSDEDPNHGSDDDEEEEEEEERAAEEAVVNLRANRGERPSYKLPDDEALEDIRPFLKDFIPKLKAANEELEAQKQAGTLQTTEIVGEDDGNAEDQYIEMNLGLGVLEEKDSNAENNESGSPNSESDGGEEGAHTQEKDIMGKLMGRDKPAAVGIQEVTDTQHDA